ncbi:Probable beta-D-xylosidase 6 [Linum perenne]
MSLHTHISHLRFIFFFSTLLLSHSSSILEYPCKPPHYNHYQLCNKTLSTASRAHSLISHQTLHEKTQQLSDNATGIPTYQWWLDSLHEIATNGPGIKFQRSISAAIQFPQVILSVAAFNRSLWFLIGAAVAVEARAMHNVGQAGLMFWAPNVNVFRNPRWGRGQETVGEDPLVGSAYAVQYVKGLQGGGNGGRRRRVGFGEVRFWRRRKMMMVSLCCLLVVSIQLLMTWKIGGTSVGIHSMLCKVYRHHKVTEQDMEDTFMPLFRGCVHEGKATCLMCSYNQVNGVPACARKDLLEKARREWDMKGYIVSDCNAVATIFEYQNYTKTIEEGVAISLKAGMSFLKVGISIELQIFVQTSKPLRGPKGYVKKMTFTAGCADVPCVSDAGFDQAVHIAEKANFVIVVAGLDLSQETEDHDRVSLLLPGKQMSLVLFVASVSKKPIILVLTGGGPIDVSFAKADLRISSILWVGYPGEAGPKALAEVIFGEYNPGGRLPMTWYPESFTKVPMNDMNMRADPFRGYPGRTYRFYNGDQVYSFGHGLSYTNYIYSLLSAPNKLTVLRSSLTIPRKRILSSSSRQGYVLVQDIASCDSLKIYVVASVTNSGEVDGSHVLLLFSRVPEVTKGTPLRQLVGFDRVHTISCSSAETSILVDPCKHLSVAEEGGKRFMALGNHVLMLGDLEHIIAVGPH